MDKKDYAMGFLVSLCVSLVIQYSGFDFATLQFNWPVISEQNQLLIVGGICAVILPGSAIILAYRIKHTQLSTQHESRGKNKNTTTA